MAGVVPKAPRQGAQLWSGWSQSSVRSLGCCRKGGRGLIWTWPFTLVYFHVSCRFFDCTLSRGLTWNIYCIIYDESFLVQRWWMFVRGAVWVQVLAIRSMALSQLLIDPSGEKRIYRLPCLGRSFVPRTTIPTFAENCIASFAATLLPSRAHVNCCN